MRLLSRTEEFVLLAVWRLQGEAYSVPLSRHLTEQTGQKWSLGAVYMPLDRLIKKEMVTSALTEATTARGGRPKRIYSLTNTGKKALLHISQVEKQMWAGIPQLSLD